MKSMEHRVAILESNMRKLVNAMSIHEKRTIKNMQIFSISAKEIERLKKFGKTNNDVIMVKAIGTGLGTVLLVKTQSEYNKEAKEDWLDITDYSCW